MCIMLNRRCALWTDALDSTAHAALALFSVPALVRLQAAKSFTPYVLAAVRRPPSSVAIGNRSTLAR